LTNHVKLILLWLLAITVFAACGTPDTTTTAQNPLVTDEPSEPAVLPATVDVAPTATPRISRSSVTVFGQVEPINWVTLSFLRDGQVEEVLVTAGEPVVVGQPLARLRTPDLQLTIGAAEAALQTVQARLAEMAAGPRPEEIAAQEAELAAAEAAVSAANAAYGVVAAPPNSAEVAAAEAQIAAAQAQERASQLSYNQHLSNEILGDLEEVARYQLLADQAALAAAQVSLDVLQADPPSPELWEASANITQASAIVDNIQAQLDLLLAGARPETLAVLQAQIREAEIALAMAQAEAEVAQEEALLLAPFDGVIISVAVRPSQAVAADEPVMVLADLAHLQVVASDLDEFFVVSVRPGQSATITFDALPGRRLTGEVTFVALRPVDQLVEEGTNYSVVIALNELDPELRWGMTANVQINNSDSP
jgi:multidrug efflux pump subunit AcrA (membrane-fusion protein)